MELVRVYLSERAIFRVSISFKRVGASVWRG